MAPLKNMTDMRTNCPRHYKTATNGLLDLVGVDPLNEEVYTALFNAFNEARDVQNIILNYDALRKKGKASEKYLYILIHLYCCSGKYEEAMKIAQGRDRQTTGQSTSTRFFESDLSALNGISKGY